MPSELATLAHRKALSIGASLWRITVTNPWYTNDPHGNYEAQLPGLGGLLAGIKSTGGKSGLMGVGRTVALPVESWIETGRTTMNRGKGVCTDCAALAALMLRSNESDARIEIVSVGTHAFVICGRTGGDDNIKDPGSWGNDAFVLDIWYANQFQRGLVEPAAWMSDRMHPVVDWIFKSAPKLRVEVEYPAGRLTLRVRGG